MHGMQALRPAVAILGVAPLLRKVQGAARHPLHRLEIEIVRDDLIWIDAWLREWARWMRDDHKEIQRMCGMPRKSAGFWSGGSGSADAFEHMVEAEDLKCIRTIDKAVRALGGQHYAALINHYVNVVAKHRGDPGALLADAIELVAAAARKAGMT